MLGAGLLARNAVQRGLTVKPWVKTSLAPGSKVVTEYLERAGLNEYLDELGLQPRRLRLHDLHRQLGAAADRDLRRRAGRGPRGRLGAVGQPQLRGADQPRREDELPRLAAAVRRLRAGRDDGHRPLRRAARHRHARQRVYLKDIWPDAAEVAQTVEEAVQSDMFRKSATARCSTATSAGTRSRSRPATGSPGTSAPPTCAGRRSSRTCRREPEPLAGHHRRARARAASATASPPTTSPPPARSSATARPRATSTRTTSRRGTSTRSARGAATTR